ncbi:MAG: hypothetical protein H6710_21305 [Myxococcales bacterium]|nr:hypothetical protein [Myxococcales bacterium]MCB9700528.1 hypothetical protein [Myxococcales bacterium]
MDTRWRHALPIAATAIVACSDPPPPGWQELRQLDYLRHSCDQELRVESVNHLIANLACEERLRGYRVGMRTIPADAWAPIFAKMWRLDDTSDFDALRLARLVNAHRGHRALSLAQWREVEDALADFKYWYTDPTPVREVDGAPVTDSMWYWSENHALVFRSAEYLAGQWMPERIFTVSGLSGAEHRERARAAILRWLDERARWGFCEWHSDVYYAWSIQPLLALIDLADEDPELVERATIVLDLLWLDLAQHLHRGNFGATHGRSYVKDKVAAPLQDTFDAAKLLFDDTTLDYAGVDSGSAVAIAVSEAYELPWVIREIARDDAPMLERERLCVPLDAAPPADPADPLGPAPLGLDYGDEGDVPQWWSMNAYITWPLLPLTFELADRYDLWNGPLSPLAVIPELYDLSQPIDAVMADVYPFYSAFWGAFTGPLLSEAHTVTYRSAEYMLSSVQDYRSGLLANQVHSWQATLDEAAIVFTQHPAYLPIAGDGPWDWKVADEPGPGYWTGEGSMPRIGQHENVAIILYAPQFDPKPPGLDAFDYLEETHAYFPQAHFDEVVQEGGWTFGRRGDAYVALYSYRPTEWRSGTPEVYENGGLPFDLVAGGGAENAWIVEVGGASEWRDFAAFRAAIAGAAVRVTAVPDQGDDGHDDGFQVIYDSPSRGEVSFGWHEPLTVDGIEAMLRWDERHEGPYVRSTFDSGRYTITHERHRLELDMAASRREATPAPR